MKVIHYSLVAHGRKSGEEFARHFSNIPSSWQSSLGFYLTDGIYRVKHGMSLSLDGVEPGVNDNARARTIVMHSADYVSKEFIRNGGTCSLFKRKSWYIRKIAGITPAIITG